MKQSLRLEVWTDLFDHCIQSNFAHFAIAVSGGLVLVVLLFHLLLIILSVLVDLLFNVGMNRKGGPSLATKAHFFQQPLAGHAGNLFHVLCHKNLLQICVFQHIKHLPFCCQFVANVLAAMIRRLRQFCQDIASAFSGSALSRFWPFSDKNAFVLKLAHLFLLFPFPAPSLPHPRRESPPLAAADASLPRSP